MNEETATLFKDVTESLQALGMITSNLKGRLDETQADLVTIQSAFGLLASLSNSASLDAVRKLLTQPQPGEPPIFTHARAKLLTFV